MTETENETAQRELHSSLSSPSHFDQGWLDFEDYFFKEIGYLPNMSFIVKPLKDVFKTKLLIYFETNIFMNLIFYSRIGILMMMTFTTEEGREMIFRPHSSYNSHSM